MRISSPEFENNGSIPKKFTCDGQDISPKLKIEDIPADTKSLALIVDDPDAPRGTWVHWIVYNIPPVSYIDENSVPGEQIKNDSGDYGYGGPCPPSGTHRYFFKIYALDMLLDLQIGSNEQELLDAMQGHVIDNAELIGTYAR
ncbi:MAG: YbhB/YbcL family Raf kinase inhibitor-like protein [Candidatus Omnitrophica bacterium]|nr:YbhB/YbcL family Raf kinase inhibitor-like protein [Candidatus Omnitrophota bacterium]